jgi:hypothetical protein
MAPSYDKPVTGTLQPEIRSLMVPALLVGVVAGEGARGGQGGAEAFDAAAIELVQW